MVIFTKIIIIFTKIIIIFQKFFSQCIDVIIEFEIYIVFTALIFNVNFVF